MMEWRSQQPTRWHRQCTNILRQILPKLELRSGSIATEKEEADLEALLEHYWVSIYDIYLFYAYLFYVFSGYLGGRNRGWMNNRTVVWKPLK